MTKKILIAILTFGLVIPAFVIAQQRSTQAVNPSNAPAVAQPSAPAGQDQTAQTERPQPQTSAQRRSYERETHTRRHHGISKKEWVFLGAVAGTSMGVGALAGGAHGLAIGAIVGGWGAYAAHRMWHWIR
jgi:hypothetical protein